jgi:hypothetical protein
MMGFLMLTPTLGSATDFVIIGGSEPQKRLVSCIAEASTGLFRDTPDLQQALTFVILEHDKFLQSRVAFHAYRTRLAYSNGDQEDLSLFPCARRSRYGTLGRWA